MSTPERAMRAAPSTPRDLPGARALASAAALALCAASPGCDRAGSPARDLDGEPGAAALDTPAEGAPGIVDRGAPVACDGFVGTSSAADCQLLWSSCADGLSRELRCSAAGDRYRCACLLGARELAVFESGDLCRLASGDPDVDRAVFTAAAIDACAWAFRP